MKNKFIQQWKHSDSPFLWVEMMYLADTKKMKKSLGFCFGGHYFINKDQTIIFYENLYTEKLATKFGSIRYNRKKFIEKLCEGARKAEAKLSDIAEDIVRENLKKKTDKEIKKIFDKFFDSYALVTGYYRAIRPEFYKAIIDSLRKKHKNLSEPKFASLISGNFEIIKIDSESKKIIKCLNKLAERRYEMHEVWQKAFLDAEVLFKEIGSRFGLSLLEVQNCSSCEIADMLNRRKKVNKIKLRERIKSYKLVYGKNKFILTSPAKEEITDKKIPEIKGTVAYGGKVKGTVVIVKESLSGTTRKTIEKIKYDSVLVTEMTSPDMVPAVKRAAAVITDVGGLLSHAAIIARELKKPCIVGTRVASSTLKDGDLVEVDANKGTVKMLKRT